MAENEEDITERSQLYSGEYQPEVNTTANKQKDSAKPCIMIAGKPANGKSTALNNIFGLELDAGISAHSVTQRMIETEVVKNNHSLKIIDTPGLGALDIKREEIAIVMGETIKSKDYTLIYCLSVSPSSRLTEEDKTIVSNLNEFLSKDVWQKCVILFTFSDTAWRDEFADNDDLEGYKDYLSKMAVEFQSILKGHDQNAPPVKTIFEDRESSDIVAFPVGKKTTSTKDILPGVNIEEGNDWTDLVFTEILKKTAEDKRKSLFDLKYGAAIASSGASTVLVTTLVGAGAGATVGAVGGPIGMVAAAGIGAAGGLVVGGITATVTAFLAVKAKKRKIKKMRKRVGSVTPVAGQT